MPGDARKPWRCDTGGDELAPTLARSTGPACPECTGDPDSADVMEHAGATNGDGVSFPEAGNDEPLPPPSSATAAECRNRNGDLRSAKSAIARAFRLSNSAADNDRPWPRFEFDHTVPQRDRLRYRREGSSLPRKSARPFSASRRFVSLPGNRDGGVNPAQPVKRDRVSCARVTTRTDGAIWSSFNPFGWPLPSHRSYSSPEARTIPESNPSRVASRWATSK